MNEWMDDWIRLVEETFAHAACAASAYSGVCSRNLTILFWGPWKILPSLESPSWDAPAGRDLSSYAEIPLLSGPSLRHLLLSQYLCLSCSAQVICKFSEARGYVLSLSFPQKYIKCLVHGRHLIHVYWSDPAWFQFTPVGSFSWRAQRRLRFLNWREGSVGGAHTEGLLASGRWVITKIKIIAKERALGLKRPLLCKEAALQKCSQPLPGAW